MSDEPGQSQLKLCKNCKWINQVHLMSHWKDWECHHPANELSVNPVNGDHHLNYDPRLLRSMVNQCGPQAVWYEPAPAKVWCDQLIYEARALPVVVKRPTKQAFSLKDLE